ncbi:MAG: type II secretion system protein GspG [Spirochaetaceae bacterium]|nr:MAG: type II secretion system protein GspG [Spirochaetaceae bacterium]
MGKRRLKGWTIAETLVGMAIVFTLTSTVGFLGARQIERARVTAAESQVRVLEVALENYALDAGDYPTTEQGLDALYTAPVLAPLPRRWYGPYLRKPVGRDPWGGSYVYRRPGPDGLPYEITYDGAGGSRE